MYVCSTSDWGKNNNSFVGNYIRQFKINDLVYGFFSLEIG